MQNGEMPVGKYVLCTTLNSLKTKVDSVIHKKKRFNSYLTENNVCASTKKTSQ